MGSKTLNIAVFIGSDLQSGGGYQYEYMVLDLLKKYHSDESINFKFYGLRDYILNDYAGLSLKIKIIKENIFQKFHRLSLSNLYIYNLFRKIKMSYSFIEKQLQEDNIDLVYFLSPSLISQGLNNVPYIFTLWDLGHLEMMEFPEVSYNREFEMRELIYTKSLKKAIKVIVDSEYGKYKAINKYNLDEHRVEVLKFLPNIRTMQSDRNIDVKQKYNLSNDYIFYPAQFWAHKNHMYILKAIKILREEKQVDIDVVFSGSNNGNLEYILKRAKDFGINDLVHYIGFVPNEEIPFLYKQSLALVMPTYLGPTNIPPLEAFAYETTVCYSDTPFFREQVGDAAFFMDLKNPYSLVEHILTIRSDTNLVKKKKKLGLELLKRWSDRNFYEKLISIFNEYKYIRELWN